MPKLYALTIMRTSIVEHGVRWSALRSLVALPQLHELNVRGLLISPREASIPDPHADTIAPISSIRYVLKDYRDRPRFHRTERDALASVLGAVSRTLETLEMPMDPVPFQTILNAHWPRLRELRLCGELSEHLPLPFIAILSGMPQLRVLSLDLAITPTTDHRPLWPPEFSTSYPWPELQELSVSFPHPEDQLYSNLPPTLSKLSLCCWPHVYEQSHPWYEWLTHPTEDLGWQQHVLTSSQTLKILSQCRVRHLTQFAVEYRAGAEDSDMLSHLAISFPQLQTLQLIRYRDPADPEIPVVSLFCDQTMRADDALI